MTMRYEDVTGQEGNSSLLEASLSYNITTTMVPSTESANYSVTANSIVIEFKPYDMPHLLITSIVLGLIIVATIIGNVFVIAAIVLEKSLQSVANYLVASLSVADLMVASLVMPLAVVSEVSQMWFLGTEICEVYVSFDVLCCTASILHLVIIALDRFWAVTQVDYIRSRTAKRMIIMITIAWVISICISIPPLFGWRNPNKDNPNTTGVCIVSTSLGYRIFATVGAFYIPLVVILIIYFKIWQAAKSRIRKKAFRPAPSPRPTAKYESECTTYVTSAALETAAVEGGNSCNGTSKSKEGINKNSKLLSVQGNTCSDSEINLSEAEVENGKPSKLHLLIKKPHCKKNGHNNNKKQKNDHIRTKEKLEHKRERKAARTLAIVTGSFIICWLPFFIGEVVGPFCGSNCHWPRELVSVILWLGYLNSLFNPIIYTIFNPDFRNAFHKILFGKYRKRNRGR